MTAVSTQKTLKDRCREMLGVLQQNAILRQGNPVEDLAAFVLSEKGRAADKTLEGTLPLVLYFGSDQDRDEFMAIVREVKPGMITKPMP